MGSGTRPELVNFGGGQCFVRGCTCQAHIGESGEACENCDHTYKGAVWFISFYVFTNPQQIIPIECLKSGGQKMHTLLSKHRPIRNAQFHMTYSIRFNT